MSYIDYLNSDTYKQQRAMLNPIGLGAQAISGVGDILSNAATQNGIQNAGRPDLAEFVSGTSWNDIINADDKTLNGIQTIESNTYDASGLNDLNSIGNLSVGNTLQDNVQYQNQTFGSYAGDVLGDMGKGAQLGSQIGSFIPGGALIGASIGAAAGALSGAVRNIWGSKENAKRAERFNTMINRKNTDVLQDIYDRASIINNRTMHDALRYYTHAEGGSLEGLNGVTEFNVGDSHENNPYGGIQQGIASDGYPNLVEENEVKYKDYIYSARLKPSKSLLKEFNLPEKYAGKTFAELADVLQKESEDRPNDPISLTTLDEWMNRLAGAQEEYKAKQEERRLAKVVDNMSDEEKAALMSSLVQPMAQQEGIDLSQPMYAKGGKIHIAKNKRGTFTAAAKKHGKSVQAFASQVLANKENYSPAMVKKANFARNAAKWKHADGGHLYLIGGDKDKLILGNEGNISNLESLVDYINTEEKLARMYPNSINGGEYPAFAVSFKNGFINGNVMYGGSPYNPEYRKVIDNFNKYYTLYPPEFREHNIRIPKKMFDTNIVSSPILPESNIIPPRDLDKGYTASELANRNYDEPEDIETMRGSSTGVPIDFENYLTLRPDTNEPTSIIGKRAPKDTINTDLLAQRLGESLRYAPAVGAQLGAITAALQPKDYTLANRLEDLASEFRPMSAPHIGGYRRYTPYDVNLGDAENIGLTAAALSANRGQNRATQGALNTAVLAKAQETSAKRNLAAQQANEANRLATDTYNLGIDQFNAQRDSAYDQLNQQILANRINMLGQAAQARDASRAAWASNINTTAENAFNQLGNVGRDNWNRNYTDMLLREYGIDGLAALRQLLS